MTQSKRLPDDEMRPGPLLDVSGEDRETLVSDVQLRAPWVQRWRRSLLSVSSASQRKQRVQFISKYPHATIYNPPPPSATNQTDADKDPGISPVSGMSPIIFGAATFGIGSYSNVDFLESDVAVRALRMAFMYGINAFDTSPHYKNSENVLGSALAAIQDEFPRTSYYIQTKCGRYGPEPTDFDYSPATIRASVLESIRRMNNAQWIDTILLHDVEWVCTQVGPSHSAGKFAERLCRSDEKDRQQLRKDMGLAPNFEAASAIHGDSDQKVLEAIRELFRLRDEGKVKLVGISGYPVPVLIRIARMIATNAPYRPVDAILTYCNLTLQNSLLTDFLPEFARDPWEGLPKDSPLQEHRGNWRAPHVINASPLSMGLLTPGGPSPWHPCLPEMRRAVADTISQLKTHEGQPKTNLIETSLHFGLRGSEVIRDGTYTGDGDQQPPQPQLRTISGFMNIDQVHQGIAAYRTLLIETSLNAQVAPGRIMARLQDLSQEEQDLARDRKRAEEVVLENMKRHDAYNVTWPSPP